MRPQTCLRFGDARPMGDGAYRRRLRRAGHPPDRPDRSAGRDPARTAPGRRSHRRVRQVARKASASLVTVLTKRMAEDLTEYLHEQGIRVRYMHSDIDTLERIEIIRDLRLGAFDVLVGINLLREGLDIPECALVAILDADKEGFLRARNVTDPDHRPRRAQCRWQGRSSMPTRSPVRCSARSRKPTAGARSRSSYNTANGITPESIKRSIARHSRQRL